jgi:hypothetical protein
VVAIVIDARLAGRAPRRAGSREPVIIEATFQPAALPHLITNAIQATQPAGASRLPR